jgi:CBS domain-containing protein
VEVFAKDIMLKEFDTIHPSDPIKDAVKKILNGRVRPTTGRKTVSLMVIDDLGNLAGVISMFDILFHFRPTFMNYGLDCIDVWQGRLKPYFEQFETLTVEQVMSTPVLTVSPDDHLMVVLDIMVKKKCRRLPVLKDSKVLGIVYLSEVYAALFKQW